MKVALCSDIHLEFADLDIKNTENADVLLLAGDIMLASSMYDFPENEIKLEWNKIIPDRYHQAQSFRSFLKRCSDEFPHVLYVAGNHEYYHGKWNQTIDTLRAECAKFPNVHFMENDVFVLDDVTFIGGTLWTDCNKSDPLTIRVLADSMNDYRLIRVEERGFGKLHPSDTVKKHRKMLELINATVDGKDDQKFVVVGHHQPSKLSAHPRYMDDHHMDGGYSSDLSEFMLDRPQIKLWVGGHTHHDFDYMIGSTRVVCNPRGYVGYERVSQQEDPYYPKIIEV